jgi:hypothetical protein
LKKLKKVSAEFIQQIQADNSRPAGLFRNPESRRLGRLPLLNVAFGEQMQVLEI